MCIWDPKLQIELLFNLDLTLMNILSLGACSGFLMVPLVLKGDFNSRMKFSIIFGYSDSVLSFLIPKLF